MLAVFALAVGCGKERAPSRDYIPELQALLNELQIGVKDKNRAALDSLLSVKILAIKQGSDSLLKYVYGPEGRFEFQRFGDAAIYYTDDLARIDAYVMDSVSSLDRPITLTFVHEHGRWLLKRFEPRTDSVISAP